MKTNSDINNLFNEEGHLNESGISVYTDSLNEKKLGELPDKILEHVEDCTICKREIIELSDIVLEIEKVQNAKKTKTQTFNLKELNKGLRLAAGFAGFIAVSAVLYFLFFKAPAYDQLYADNFTPYADVITSRSDEDLNVDSTLVKVVTHYYNTQKYDSAAIFFEILYKRGIQSDVLLFYYANTCLSLEEYNFAIRLFNELQKKEHNLFKEQTPWYLSLSYLGKSIDASKKERRHLLDESKIILHEIAGSNSSYKSKAEKLLKQF